jgi:hypothetical protein
VKKQKHSKDCLQACLAELLSIDYSEVPEFYKIFPNMFESWTDEEFHRFRNEFDKWLSSRGYIRVTIDVIFDKESYAIHMPYVSSNFFRCIGILEKPDRKYSHAVVLSVTDNSKIEMDDPKEDSDYDLSDIKQIELFFRSGEPEQAKE